MKKGDLVKYNSRQFLGNGVFGIILSELDDGYSVVWQINGRLTESKWYSFRDLVPLTLESSKELFNASW